MIDISPNYINAYLNLSTLYVNLGNELIDKMNNLGDSTSENARYDNMSNQKKVYFKKAAEVLERGIIHNPNNIDLLEQLKNIYGALGDGKNFRRIEKMLK